jgi:hypothetical protein
MFTKIKEKKKKKKKNGVTNVAFLRYIYTQRKLTAVPVRTAWRTMDVACQCDTLRVSMKGLNFAAVKFTALKATII